MKRAVMLSGPPVLVKRIPVRALWTVHGAKVGQGISVGKYAGSIFTSIGSKSSATDRKRLLMFDAIANSSLGLIPGILIG